MTELMQLALRDLHVALGGKLVPFAGYDMPVQYQGGVLKEHLHVRAAAGLFDVSHMGQVILRPRGTYAQTALALESLMPVDVLGLAVGRQRYGMFTNETGGILDDLMFANRGDHILVVVNAACKFGKLASGSPMPMTTIFVIRSSAPSNVCARNTCSIISPADRFRFRPNSPLAQKTQPIAQPTCVLMQTVTRSGSRINTHSMCSPSASLSSSFSVRSEATW